jgi:hypothetical protein
MVKECRHCGLEFETDCPEKRKVGGYINECVDCVIEGGGDKAPRYLAVAAGNGKMSDITILEFDNDKDKDAYQKMWKTNTGFYKGKSCQIGRGLTSTSGYKFRQKAEFRGNDNHKGRAD